MSDASSSGNASTESALPAADSPPEQVREQPASAANDRATAETPKPSPPSPRWSRRLLNGGLILFVLAVLAAWYWQHVHPLLGTLPTGAQTLATLVFVVGVLAWVVKHAYQLLSDEEARKRWRREFGQGVLRFLAEARWTVPFAIVTVLSVALYFGTTSVYFVYDDGATQAVKLAVVKEVAAGKLDAAQEYVFPTANRVCVQGDLDFPDFGWHTLTFDVTQPPGRHVPAAPLGWVRSKHLAVPSEFEELRVRMFRILPPPRLLVSLPRTVDDPTRTYTYEFRIMVDGAETPYVLNDVRQGSVCFGPHKQADMQWWVDQESEDSRQTAFQHALGGGPLAGTTPIIQAWKTPVAFCRTAEVPDQSTVRVEVWKITQDAPPKLVAERETAAAKTTGIQTITLEHKP